MSDHILKNNQAKAGHTNSPGIKLKPVSDATKLILEGAKAAVTNTNGGDKVRDTDREMDLTFYDANGNIETADPDGNTSMENDTTMQSVEHGEDVSGVTTPSDGATDFTSVTSGTRGGSVPVSINDKERLASVEDRATHSEDDGSDYEYNEYAFREKKTQPCDNAATDGDSEMP